MEWNHGIMESWNHGIMESWNHGIMELYDILYVFHKFFTCFSYLSE
jgi:hypothetical protein